MQTVHKSGQWKHLVWPTGLLYRTLILFLITSLLLPTSGVQAQTLITADFTGGGSGLTGNGEGLANISPALAEVHAQTFKNLSTPELISQALEAGQIDSDTANLFRAYAIGNYEKLPQAYRSDVPWDGTLTLLDLRRSLSAGAIGRYRSEIASLLSSGGACGESNVTLPNVYSGLHFYIEYGTIGGGLSISDYAIALDTAWNKEIEYFGWAAPPVLASNPPPGNLYHVRIDSLGPNLYGYIDFSGVHAGLVGNNPKTSWDDVDAYATCMVLNNDFSVFSGGAQHSLDATIAHEFNHAIQYGYGAFTGSNKPADIFIEGGAAWMEDEVFDSNNDNYQYLWPDFKMPMGNYQCSDLYCPYRYWITFRGLTERYDYDTETAVGAEQVMQDFWETLSKGTSGDGIAALNAALGNRGTNLNDAFHAYAIAVKFNKTCGGKFVYPYCFKEAEGYVNTARATTTHHSIESVNNTYTSNIAEGYAIHWVSLPVVEMKYKVTLQNTSTSGSLRGSVVCDTGSELKIRAFSSVVGGNESASIDGFDPSGCSSVVAVLTNQSTGTSATYFELKVEAVSVISGNTGVAGVTLSYIDGTLKTVTSNGSGNYSIPVSYNWSGTVTPSETGLTFTPVSRSYTNVVADQTAQDYTAIGTWQTVGAAGFSPGEAKIPSLALNNGTPYVAYFGDYANLGDLVTVMKYDGSNWVTVGPAGSSSENLVHSVSLAIANNTPYVAYASWLYRPTVRMFNGSNWIPTGEITSKFGAIYDVSLDIANGTPYVAFSSSNGMTVIKFDAKTGKWDKLGPDFAVDYGGGPPSLAVANGTPYVAYVDSGKVTAMKYDGSNWVPVGSAGFSEGRFPSLAITNCTPYVAYQDFSNWTPPPTISTIPVTVMKYDGSNWVPVGSAGFSEGSAWSPSLAFTGGIPYVAFNDSANAGKATVMKFDALTGNWVTAGPAGFSASGIGSPSLAAANGKLYVAYQDSIFNGKATVMTYVDVSNFPDAIPPSIETFTIDSPASGSLDIPITAFIASDLAGVTGYMITKIPIAPAPDDPGWSEEAPTTYTVEGSGIYTLYPWAKDAAGNVSALSCLSGSVKVDATPPTVATFTATSPSSSFNIPITAFTASDDTGVTGYKITESSTAPAAGDPGWSATAPTMYTVGAEGNYTLYPWVKDTAGNVSTAYSSPASVQVDLPPAVVSFIVALPSSSLDIPIIQFAASDSIGLAGYMITESPTPPAAGDPGWSVSAPTTYTVEAEGNYTLYPWVKDAVGNVSAVYDYPASVIVRKPDTLIVTNNADSGAGSLRQAIADAKPGDIIIFDASLAAGTITLASTLTIDKSLTIDGSSLTSPVTISGADAYGVFYVSSDIYSGTVTFNSLTIRNGNFNKDGGAGIANKGVLTVTNCTLSDNIAGNGGGIYNAGMLTVANSTFSGNSAGNGGAIYNAGMLTVANSTFSGNSAGIGGGGIYNFANATVTNSTLSDNSADWSGGGIYNNSRGTLNYFNTIVANSASGDDVDDLGNSSSKNNLIGTVALGELADNGGPTQTMALPAGSLAIDAGDNAICAAAPVNGLDQRGVARDAPCDIGAYEYVVSPDTTAPTVDSFTAISPSSSLDISITVFIASDDIGVTGYLITQSAAAPAADDAGWGNTAPTTYTVSEDGSYTLYPWVKDAAGNVSGLFGSPAFVTVDATPPTVDAGSYQVDEAASVTVTASGDDTGNGPLTYVWDLDNDGSFETPGQNATFSANSLDGPSTHTIAVQVADSGGLTTTDQAIVNVLNVAPTADFTVTPGTVTIGQPTTLSFSNPLDPSAEDVAAGFHYSYDCTNDGTFELASASDASYTCTYPAASTFAAHGRLEDKDGGFTDYTVGVVVSGPGEPTITVNTLDEELNADGDCSLREAITAANTNVAADACAAGVPGADTITFSITGTITLGSSLPAIADALTIEGPGAASLTISGNNAVGVFTVNVGKTFNLRKVTIANGRGNVPSGILNNGGTLTVAESIIANNQGLDGAGIYNANGGTVNLVDSSLSGNVAEGWGGGIYNSGTFTVTRSSLLGNRSEHSWLSYGGGAIANRGTLSVIDSTLTGNVADCFGCPGGGLYNMSGTATILNSTFSGNIASVGGGVFNQRNAAVTIMHSTFSDNQGPLGGNSLESYGVIMLRNSIVATGAPGGNCYSNPFLISNGGYNLQFPGASCGDTIPVGNPQLGPLQDNGGSTFTHPLLAGSPAIDAIPQAACGFATTDQRGVTRPQGSACDIGAFELIQNQQPIVNAGGPYAVNEGDSILVTASGSDPEEGTLTFAWDLDGDGTFETPGQSATFSADALNGPNTFTIKVQVTDIGGLTATAKATVNVLNVAPTANFTVTPSTLLAGLSATLSFSNSFDPSAQDVAAGFHYSYDCTNDGTFELENALDASYICPYPTAGTFTALGRIADEDGDSTDYMVPVSVLTPQQATRGLITNIDDLVAGNMLNSGRGNALIAKLEMASRQVDRGNVIPAINQLHTFINQVNALIGSGALPPIEGRPLIDEANAIIAALMG